MVKKFDKVVVSKVLNKYICTSPKYSFIGEGSSPSVAIKNYQNQETEYLKKIKDLKIEINSKEFEEINEIQNNKSFINIKSNLNWPKEILMHLLKSIITLILLLSFIVLALNLVSKSLNTKLNETLASIENEITYLRLNVENQIDSFIKGNQDSDISLGDKIEKEINRGAEQPDIEPERKERIIKNLEITAERYKPYIQAIKKLFED